MPIRQNVDLGRWGIKFDGTGRDMTVESFIFRIERMREKQHVSFDQLFADFHCLVSGVASKWYWQILEDQAENRNFGYPELKWELLSHFKSAESDYDIIKEIMERKQAVHEPFDEYYSEVHNLTFRLRRRIPERELINIIKQNLNRSLGTLVFATEFRTLSEVKNECRKAEKMFKDHCGL